jgi:hypothetical protein
MAESLSFSMKLIRWEIVGLFHKAGLSEAQQCRNRKYSKAIATEGLTSQNLLYLR